MRTLLIVCVASLATSDVWAQVAPVARMGTPVFSRADTRIGENAANLGARATRGSVPTTGRSYTSFAGQNNNTAFGRTTIAAPAAMTLGQPFVNPDQPMVFQGGGAQSAMFPNSLPSTRNGGFLVSQGAGGLPYSPATGLGNINVQARQIAQTPAPTQTRQAAQISAPVQLSQPRQASAPYNVPSTSNSFQAIRFGGGGSF